MVSHRFRHFVRSFAVVRVVVPPAHCALKQLNGEHVIAFVFEVYEGSNLHGRKAHAEDSLALPDQTN
jgi:hypothetical protein